MEGKWDVGQRSQAIQGLEHDVIMDRVALRREQLVEYWRQQLMAFTTCSTTCDFMLSECMVSREGTETRSEFQEGARAISLLHSVR